MPGFPFPGRPGGEHDEPLLDMIISRRALPPDAPPEMHDLAHMLAALAGPGEPGELAGEEAARAAFARSSAPASLSPAARRPARRQHRSRRAHRLGLARAGLSVTLAVTLAAVAAGLAVLAAYANLLPRPVQQLAHVAVAAPAPSPARSTPSPAAGSLLNTGGPAPVGPTAGTAHDSGHATPRASQPRPSQALPTWRDTSPDYTTAAPSCQPVQGKQAKPDALPSAWPGSVAWAQALHCDGSLPAAVASPVAPGPKPSTDSGQP